MTRSIVRAALVGCLAFSLAGCGGLAALKEKFDTGRAVLTTTVVNPVTPEQVAALEAAYGVAQSGVLVYMELRQCRRSEVASATNWCGRRSVKLELQAASRKAEGAMEALRNFVRRNQTLNAISAFRAAQAAVRDYRAVAYINGAT